jgi:DNA repair protein RadC
MAKDNVYLQKENSLVLDVSEKAYVLKLRDLPQDEKPREKLIKYGVSNCSVAELLSILLNVGTKKEDVLAMSRRLLKEYGDGIIFTQKDPKKLANMLGIPLIKSCQLVACFELGKRFFKSPTSGSPIVIRTAGQVFDYLKDMRELSKEYLRGLYLDTHYQLIHDEVISIGSLNSNIIHPREVFRPAIEYSATAIILAHNHPSGVSSPSDADIAITKQIIEAGKIIGISVLDHVIITKKGYKSIPVEY